jgi:Domain of unknown function (DUF4335)
MASNNSTTRTYTAPTCTLILGDQDKQLASSSQSDRLSSADFTLHLDDPDQGKSECITLQGQFHQLDRLQQVTSEYIAELVARFPLPTIDDRAPVFKESQSPSTDRSTNSVHQLDHQDESQTPNSDIIENESGSADQFSEESVNPASLFSLQSVSKLLGYSSEDDRTSKTPDNSEQQPPREPVMSATTSQTPAWMGGDSALDHKLQLGDLATTTSGVVLTLSAIQLFDLATVLDEYLSDALNNPPQSGSKTSHLAQQPVRDRSNGLPPAAIAPKSNKQAEPDRTAASLSRLPNLPKIPADPEHTHGYRRTRRARSGFTSAIPWAAAAAVAVGAPFLFLSKPNNPPKQATNQTTTPTAQAPNLNQDAGKSVTSPQPSTPTASVPTPTTSVPTPTAGMPTPWQAQPVQPPQNNTNLPITGIQQPQNQNSSKIGIAPLPPSILGTATPESQTQVSKGQTRLPARASTPSLSPNNTALIPPTQTTTTPPGTIPQKSVNSGKISVSTQPLPILQDQPVVTPTTRSIGKSNMMPSRGNNPARQVSPAPMNPQNQQDMAPTNGNNSPPNISNSSPKENVLTPLPKIDPRALPPNPNIITSPSESPNNIAGAEFPTPQVVPEQPLPSNAARVGPDAADNPSLQEAKRYFQGKWKAVPNQPNSLQYVLEVNGKSGVVQNVDPQGEAATNYLKQTKMIKPGQKLVAPVAGSGNQKIRVLLQPDGNVDTLIEP